MNYNELLNKLSAKLSDTKRESNVKKKETNTPSSQFLKEDITSTLLNQIGLEVHRQGG